MDKNSNLPFKTEMCQVQEKEKKKNSIHTTKGVGLIEYW
jgi:hypothetical protein